MTATRDELIRKLERGEPLSSDDRLRLIGFLQIRAGHNIQSWRAETAPPLAESERLAAGDGR